MDVKIIHLKNLKRECVLVELPEGAKNIRTGDWGNFVYDSPIEGVFAIDTLVPLAYRKFLGKLTDLKEEDFYYLVDSVEQHGSWPYADIYFLSYKDSSYSCCTPKESFISAIEAEGWYTENPYGKEEPIVDDPDPNSQYYGSQMDLALEWNFYQQKVINLDNTYVFVGKEFV